MVKFQWCGNESKVQPKVQEGFSYNFTFPVRCQKRLNSDDLSPTQKINLEKVDDHCLLHIMSFLDLMDTINLGAVSTHMKSIAMLSYSRFTHFSFGASSTDVSELRSRIEEIGGNLQSIEIFRLNTRMLNCLSEYCPNVTQLKLVNSSHIFDSMSFAQYKSFFKSITSLEIRTEAFFLSSLRRVKRFQRFDELLIVLKDAEALESLKIDYIEISPQTQDHLKALKNLKCLHLNRYQETVPLLPFIPNFPHLNEFLLSVEDEKTNELIAEMSGENLLNVD